MTDRNLFAAKAVRHKEKHDRELSPEEKATKMRNKMCGTTPTYKNEAMDLQA
jgi:hypothetical protein